MTAKIRSKVMSMFGQGTHRREWIPPVSAPVLNFPNTRFIKQLTGLLSGGMTAANTSVLPTRRNLWSGTTSLSRKLSETVGQPRFPLQPPRPRPMSVN